MRPGKGLGAVERLRGGVTGVGGIGRAAAGSDGHTQESMRNNHTRAISTSWSAAGIPLRPGLNELIVTARGVTGTTATASLLVTCDAAASPVRVGAMGGAVVSPRS